MRILFYQTNHRAENRIMNAMQANGYDVIPFTCPLQGEEQREQYRPLVLQLIREKMPDMVFSMGYVAGISDFCMETGILYLANCSDVPDMVPFEANLTNDCNRILVADSDKIPLLQSMGATDVYYVPIAPLLTIASMRGNAKNVEAQISFVGSMHEENLYTKFSVLPDSIRGYMDGVLTAQTKMYGYSLYDDLFEDSFWEIMTKVLNSNGAMSEDKMRYMVKNYFFDEQVTKLERKSLLVLLQERFGEAFRYYAQKKEEVGTVMVGSRIPFGAGLANHYHNTPININITNRARHTGIPQKVWDVLACGGFLISNYQQDFEGVLVPNEDFVMFGGAGELMELTEFYLRHPEERERIAQNGLKKVQEMHNYEMRFNKIFG